MTQASIFASIHPPRPIESTRLKVRLHGVRGPVGHVVGPVLSVYSTFTAHGRRWGCRRSRSALDHDDELPESKLTEFTGLNPGVITREPRADFSKSRILAGHRALGYKPNKHTSICYIVQPEGMLEVTCATQSHKQSSHERLNVNASLSQAARAQVS